MTDIGEPITAWKPTPETVCWWGRCLRPAAVTGTMTMRGVQRQGFATLKGRFGVSTLILGYVQLCPRHWDRIRKGLLSKSDRRTCACRENPCKHGSAWRAA